MKQGGNYAAASTVGFNGIETPHVTTYTGGANVTTRIDSLEKVVAMSSCVGTARRAETTSSKAAPI